MNILFFQNCISPHQMPYIKTLLIFQEVREVWVVVPEIDMISRKEMGWDATKMLQEQGIKYLVNPHINEVSKLLEQYSGTDTWCLFSGINSFSMVSECFKISLRYDLKRGIITEPPFIYNHPLWQHAIRFVLKDWKHVHRINKLFVMGDEFISYYRFWSKRWTVVPFMYCTEWKERVQKNVELNESSKLKVLYVGSLSHRKNVQLLLKAAQLLDNEQQSKLQIGLIGDGETKNDLEALAQLLKNNTEVIFYGTQAMDKVASFMEQYDVLCLPSLHDGWGAVVNEALTLGLYVICSNHCGAKYLIKQSENLCGQIFISDDTNSLKTTLQNCIIHKLEIQDDLNKRIKWARYHIKEEIVARYLLDNLKE